MARSGDGVRAPGAMARVGIGPHDGGITTAGGIGSRPAARREGGEPS
ncbi:hypothetical protein FRACA_390010 [Frankia canadensis]|uniref:Uncharacterized protein n=1 Tax=Frankia canadensis TaxID=1836972 RepID=A0A2I2KW73_9ACTN|nr:hypothetical protein FRACA_390010 [Frankia canadensis]SOU57186.1 hypothetical protein FRACA_390010 [Frankia canadensis]